MFCAVIPVNNYFLIIANNERTIEIVKAHNRNCFLCFNNRFLSLNVVRQVDYIKVINYLRGWMRGTGARVLWMVPWMVL